MQLHIPITCHISVITGCNISWKIPDHAYMSSCRKPVTCGLWVYVCLNKTNYDESVLLPVKCWAASLSNCECVVTCCDYTHITDSLCNQNSKIQTAGATKEPRKDSPRSWEEDSDAVVMNPSTLTKWEFTFFACRSKNWRQQSKKVWLVTLTEDKT